jgi:hypothetical protein
MGRVRDWLLPAFLSSKIEVSLAKACGPIRRNSASEQNVNSGGTGVSAGQDHRIHGNCAKNKHG